MNRKSVESGAGIGGYFGLSLPDYGDQFPGVLKLQSGRAAIRALLECINARRVLMPAYICDSVIDAVRDAGAVAEFYKLDNSLYPQRLPLELGDGVVLLYVNYFGLCDRNVRKLLQSVPGRRIIIDNSQALFSGPTHAIGTIYSPRKWLGVPDGGLLSTCGVKVREPVEEDATSIERTRHLIIRAAYSARDGYSGFLESEKMLDDTEPKTMSRVTRRLLASVDLGEIKRKRRENFRALAEQLDAYNVRRWILDSDAVPLCYPLVVNFDLSDVKKVLSEMDIYIPTYWNDASERITQSSFEYQMVKKCLFVPCDQRYSTEQLVHVAQIIVSLLHNS